MSRTSFTAKNPGSTGPERLCECGNNNSREGFYECDLQGRPVSGSELLCCDRCGRIFERATAKEFGHRSFTLPDVS